VASIRGRCGGVAGHPGVSTDSVGTGGGASARRRGRGVQSRCPRVASGADVLSW
jgi:hypothetical protein